MSTEATAATTTETSAPSADTKDFLSFSIRLAGGAVREVTAFRRKPGGPWTVRIRQGRKRCLWRTLGVVGSTKEDVALARKRATVIYQELADQRFAPKAEAPAKAAPTTTIGKLLEIYARDIRIETDISIDVVGDNCRRLTLLVAETLGIDREAAKEQPITVLTRAFVERFQDARMKKVATADNVARGRARRTMDGLLNKARSLFTDQALACYRKAKLELPDLTAARLVAAKTGATLDGLAGFVTAPMKGSWNSTGYQPIAPETLEEMNTAAWAELRAANPPAFLAYLMMSRLGMRNSEAQEACRDWIEWHHGWVKKDGTTAAVERLPFMAIIARPGWDGPKNGTNRRVPIAQDVLEQLEQFGGQDHLLGTEANRRDEIVHRDLCNFVRRFLPALKDGGRVKSAYELRKHFGAVIASTQGLDRAAEYLGDRRDTVERHYHAWLQTGTARPMRADELTPQILAAVA